jgi:hypothetical protein
MGAIATAGEGMCGARTTRLAAISRQNIRRGAFSVFARLLGPETKGKELVADLVVA